MSARSADSVDEIVQRLIRSLDDYEVHGRVDRVLREIESGLVGLRHHADADASWVEALTEVWVDLEIIYALAREREHLF